jgi:3-hydroxyacyl-CoA dehydrogenase
VKKRIKKVAVLGSGTMGSGIAAQLANAGIKSYLLDIVPKELTEEDKKKKLTPESPAFRNKIAEANKQKAVNGRPPLVMNKEDADLITVGNMEDNLSWLSECDWIVEVVPENLDIKKEVLKNVQPYIKPGTIVTTNTSGISVNRIVEEMPLEFRQYWLGTHFFNPVRYMKLLEIIPCNDTLPEVVQFMADFGERVLGKGIVYCKDTPNFIANRLGVRTSVSFTQKTDEFNLTIDEVDAIAGPAMGRPRTAVYGLADLVGLDISVASCSTVYNNVSGEEKELFIRPAWYNEMAARGLLGNKAGGGFYKKAGKDKLVIDVKTFEYRPIKQVSFPSVDAALKEKSFTKKMEIFFESDDVAAQFVWRHQRDTFLYAAAKLGEISNDILNMDRAMRWGYNFPAGPFEMWNGLDLPKYIARMEAEGCQIPAWVKEMLAAGITSFYKTEAGVEYYYCAVAKKYVPIQHKPEVIVLPELKAQNKEVLSDPAGSLYDIGDGVVCLQLTNKSTFINGAAIDFIKKAQEELNKNWEGMVITGSGSNFCTGNDLAWVMEQINNKNWDAIDAALKNAQDTFMAIKYSDKPIVAAVYGQTRGSGCEMAMQAAGIQLAGETSMGLVDFSAGLVPAHGAVKELVLRAMEKVKGTSAFVLDFLTPFHTNLYQAKVSGSGKDAKNLGYAKATDKITLNNDFLLYDAKQRVLSLLEDNYCSPVNKPFAAIGKNALGPLKAKNAVWLGMLSEYDWHIICKLADIMAGGDIIAGSMITEQYLLDLEREAYLSLAGEAKTQERITSMLTKGKPLRN